MTAWSRFAAIACVILTMFSSANARDLTVATKEVPLSTDPHWSTLPVSFQINSMIFEPLIARDDDSQPRPGLAESWDVQDDVNWTFRLRKGVKWHNGEELTSADVKFTYGRAANVPNSPAGFGSYLNQIKTVETPDPYTVKITTTEPAPALLDKLAYVLIVSQRIGEKATTADYNAGKAAIGTGPYTFVSWSPNDQTILAANPNHRGGKQPWDKVIFKVISNDSTRVAALLSGSVDVIHDVPPNEAKRLEANSSLTLWRRAIARLCYLSIDVDKAVESGKVTGPNGEPLNQNPLADVRVRMAMSLAIDREAIVRKIYDGEALATTQYLPKEASAYNPSIPVSNFDARKARDLLSEAGWAGKFSIDLSVAPAFFPLGGEATEAIAQAWTQIGIPTKVSAMPYAIFLAGRNERKLPIGVGSYVNSVVSGEGFYTPVMHTRDPRRGLGIVNPFGYSNPKFDQLVQEAMRTMNAPRRSQLFADAAKVGVEDYVVFPLWFFNSIAASKKGLTVKSRADGQLLATNITPGP